MRRGIIGLESAVDAVRVGNTKRATSLHGRYPESELRVFVPDESDAVAVWRPLWREFVDRFRSQAAIGAGLRVEDIDVAVARTVGGKGDLARVRRPGWSDFAEPRCSRR